MYITAWLNVYLVVCLCVIEHSILERVGIEYNGIAAVIWLKYCRYGVKHY